MGRRRHHVALNVFLNHRHIGLLIRDPSGAIEFRYDRSWLDWENALPVSLSLPLQDTAYKGAPVNAVFENLLPDRDTIRRRVAERVGADGIDAFSLLARIGRDCVGALQFLPEGEDNKDYAAPEGIPVTDDEIEAMLANLEHAPLGLDEDDSFRISIAGAQEKTALLWLNNQWLKPLGTSPTTHILKPQIGKIEFSSGTVDLSNSVENEYYCLKLMEAFGLTATATEIAQFGQRRVLVVKRFDRRWTKDQRLIRLPQEDCCQALSIPPTRKYQSHGGPSAVSILKLLEGSDTALEDQIAFFKSLILFWLIGATDGHGKNVSVFLGPGGRYRLTPFYDVMTAQLAFNANQIRHNQYKLAMSVGNSRHYTILGVNGRHFRETAKEADLGSTLIDQAINDLLTEAPMAFEKLASSLSNGFPADIHEGVQAAALQRLKYLES